MQGRRRSGRQNSCRKDAGLALEELERSLGQLAWQLLFALKRGRATVLLKYLFHLPPPPASFVKALKGSLALQKSTLSYGSSLDTHLPLAPLFQGNRNIVRASVKQKAACFGMTLKRM